jgi:hypothetical protein
MKELEAKFALLFDKLRVTNTVDIIKKTVKPLSVKKEINAGLLGLQ